MLNSEHNTALSNLSALIDFSKLINSSLDVNFTLNNLLLTCFGKFHTTKGFIALLNDEELIKIHSSKGFNETALKKFPGNLDAENYKTNESLKDFLASIKAGMYKEIYTSEGLKGFLVLGERLIKRDYTPEDHEFVETLINIAATAIDNSIAVEQIKKVNKELDAKVNQMSTLFDLSKEFSGILKREMVGKLLVFSIIGQLMVSKFAVYIVDNGTFAPLENKFPGDSLEEKLTKYNILKLQESISGVTLASEMPDLKEIGVELIVPMQMHGENKGLIILGRRITGQPFSKTDIEYVYSIGSLAIISIENSRLFEETLEKQRMEKDLELARNIQQNLLPKSIPQPEPFEIAAYNQSAKRVGGDYYDVIKLDEDNVLIAIADVSGKGVQASLLVANLQAFLKSICKQNLPLDEATNQINDLVSENTIMGSFITFFWGILNVKKLTLSYVNAGHNPPLLIRNGEIIKLKVGGMIIGVMETIIPYLSDTIQLEKNDAIFLFTDGISEAMNIKGEEFSDERLENLVATFCDKPAKEFMDLIMGEIKNYTTGAEQSDDITALIVKVN